MKGKYSHLLMQVSHMESTMGLKAAAIKSSRIPLCYHHDLHPLGSIIFTSHLLGRGVLWFTLGHKPSLSCPKTEKCNAFY